MFKKLFFFVLFVFTFSFMKSQNFEDNGITYSILNATDVTVTYSETTTYTGEIVIPSNVTYLGANYKVTEIGALAFVSSTITKVTLPNTIKAIRAQAFSNCTKLVSLNFPNSITIMEGYIFENSYKLATVRLPNLLQNIGDNTFANCKVLTSVYIPASVQSIGGGAFFGCVLLKNIECDIVIPRNINAGVFTSVNKSSCSLTVPAGSVAAYKAANIWKDFNPIIASSTLNLNESSQISNVVLYPNHAKSEINFVLNENQKVSIYSIDGKLLKTVNAKKGSNTINVNNLPNGNYILKTKNSSQKLIKY